MAGVHIARTFAHVGAKTHYNINPVELYDLASVQQDLGWSHESKQTILGAEKILGLKSYYAKGLEEETDIFLNYTYSGEKLSDVNYFAREPQYNRSICTLMTQTKPFLQHVAYGWSKQHDEGNRANNGNIIRFGADVDTPQSILGQASYDQSGLKTI